MLRAAETISPPPITIFFTDGGSTGDSKVKYFFKGLTNKVEHHLAIILKCFDNGVFSEFPIEMRNDVPTTKLLAIMVA
jgi:hypothetical protein